MDFFYQKYTNGASCPLLETGEFLMNASLLSDLITLFIYCGWKGPKLGVNIFCNGIFIGFILYI